MCGIVAIVSRPSSRPVPLASDLVALLDRAVAASTLTESAVLVAEVDHALHGMPGMLALVGRSELIAGIGARLDQIDGRIVDRERALEAGNMLAKSLTFLAGADAAGIVLGARVPIILTSRADSLIARLASCAVATLIASARRKSGSKALGRCPPAGTWRSARDRNLRRPPAWARRSAAGRRCRGR